MKPSVCWSLLKKYIQAVPATCGDSLAAFSLVNLVTKADYIFDMGHKLVKLIGRTRRPFHTIDQNIKAGIKRAVSSFNYRDFAVFNCHRENSVYWGKSFTTIIIGGSADYLYLFLKIFMVEFNDKNDKNDSKKFLLRW